MNPLLVCYMVQAMTIKCYLKGCSSPVTALTNNAFSVSKEAFALPVTSINLSQTQTHHPSFPQPDPRQLHSLRSSYLLIPTPPLPLPSSHSLQW